jgi:hypothetical protein
MKINKTNHKTVNKNYFYARKRKINMNKHKNKIKSGNQWLEFNITFKHMDLTH